MWFDKKDFKFTGKTIIQRDLYGYILPQAGTKYTADITTHTLQMQPKREIKKIYIFYYPTNSTENITVGEKKYFHEFYVPWMSLNHVITTFWKKKAPMFYNINIAKTSTFPKIDFNDSLIIMSMDFSHYMDFQTAIDLENRAAASLLFKNSKHKVQQVVDDMRTFNFVMSKLDTKYMLQWVGRSMSPGTKAVGYLTFLIVEKHTPSNPDGLFISAYDTEFRTKECLGNWYSNTSPYSKEKEKELLAKVVKEADTSARLTGGKHLEDKVKYCTSYYLYKTNTKFIRGFHGLKKDAFYLPSVFLENTYENGTWIKSRDKEWKKGSGDFKMAETLKNLTSKAGGTSSGALEVYDVFINHYLIK